MTRNSIRRQLLPLLNELSKLDLDALTELLKQQVLVGQQMVTVYSLYQAIHDEIAVTQVHNRLLGELDRLLSRYHAKEADIEMEIVFFLKQWLVEHIFSVDKRYVPELRAAGIN